jgi:carotenoid cleavage dioxygenase
MAWDPDLVDQGLFLSRFHPELPTRLGVLPRRGDGAGVRWFEFAPTYVLHWTNAWEDGDEVVVEGFFQSNPEPDDLGPDGPPDRSFRFIAQDVLGTRLHRWRMNLVTGATSEEDLTDTCSEFGIVAATHAGRPSRYVYAATNRPGWFLFDGFVRHDTVTGAEERYALPEGVYGSEVGVAPRPGATAEDDAYLVTLTTDVVGDRSECLVFDAARLADGPVARMALPERISSGTHSCWAPSSALPGWPA